MNKSPPAMPAAPRAKPWRTPWWNALLCVALALSASATFAQVASDNVPPQFTDVAEERRFHLLVSELRCVMCQNQSLADSNAQIAVDLRHEVLALMRAGKTDAQVKEFLVARYGEFVLYRPKVESTTWLLWFGPALLLLAGGFVVAGVVRKRASKLAVEDDHQEW
jgi:cytochrome c-type biogenesis protein CcmH